MYLSEKKKIEGTETKPKGAFSMTSEYMRFKCISEYRHKQHLTKYILAIPISHIMWCCISTPINKYVRYLSNLILAIFSSSQLQLLKFLRSHYKCWDKCVVLDQSTLALKIIRRKIIMTILIHHRIITWCMFNTQNDKLYSYKTYNVT